MKSILLRIVICCTCWLQGYAQEGIEFRTESFEEVLELAKREKKWVFVDVYTSWCGPCKSMMNNVFPDPKVGAFYNKHFLCMKVDAEKQEKELMTTHKVGAYPTYLIFDEEGNLKYRFKGAMDAEAFIAEGQNALKSGQSRDYSYWLKNYAIKGYEPGFFREFVDAVVLRGLNAALFFEHYWATRYTDVLDDKGVLQWMERCESSMMDVDEFMKQVVDDPDYKNIPDVFRTGPVAPITTKKESALALGDLIVKRVLEIMQVQRVMQLKDYALRVQSRELLDCALAAWDKLPEEYRVGECEVFELEFLQATGDTKAYVALAIRFLNRLRDTLSREVLLEKGKREIENLGVLGMKEEKRASFQEMYCDLYFNYVEKITRGCMKYCHGKKQLPDIQSWAEYAERLKPNDVRAKQLLKEVKKWRS